MLLLGECCRQCQTASKLLYLVARSPPAEKASTTVDFQLQVSGVELRLEGWSDLSFFFSSLPSDTTPGRSGILVDPGGSEIQDSISKIEIAGAGGLWEVLGCSLEFLGLGATVDFITDGDAHNEDSSWVFSSIPGPLQTAQRQNFGELSFKPFIWRDAGMASHLGQGKRLTRVLQVSCCCFLSIALLLLLTLLLRPLNLDRTPTNGKLPTCSLPREGPVVRPLAWIDVESSVDEFLRKSERRA